MKVVSVIPSREKDLGGLTVRRILPYATQRMVGPFIFLDHMGPADFAPGQGINVRPHPHIHLATVTYLFEGKIHHRDSLGSDQMIEPGAINWMIAGQGIVHSERTPPDHANKASRLHGLQCWIALPQEFESMAPQFFHHPSKDLPEFMSGKASIKLLLGSALGEKSPVQVQSDMFYIDVQIPMNESLHLPCHGMEAAAYVVRGKIKVQETVVEARSMAVAPTAEGFVITALEDSRLILLGGKPVGERYLYWNFVSSKPENLEEAKREWALGPGDSRSRFPKVPGDDLEFIPLPQEVNPPGTAL